MAETLKPCPFCRNEALMDESGYKYLDGVRAMYGYSARGIGCGARVVEE